MRVRQDYVNIGSAARPRLVHYRRAGQGPPLIMLHPSPLSSASLLPMLRVAAGFRTAIAPDTPGYGWSAPLPEPGAGLTGYVDALLRFTERLGLSRFGLYGTATGAQVAIEFAKTATARVDYVILDNVAHFTAAERKRILAGYFPDLTPDALGGHLTRTWSLARELGTFFPWHEPEPGNRLPGGGVDADQAHHIAMEYLQAGKDYDLAYRAAFANEKMEQLRPLRIPVTIMRWEGSILKPYSDRFDRVRWPDNFSMLHCGPEPEHRTQAFADLLSKDAPGSGDTDCKAPDANATGGAGFSDGSSGQWHYRQVTDERLPPLLALHDVNSSSRSLQDVMNGGKYQVFAPDLPGHGLSWRPQPGEQHLATVADALCELARARYREPLTILAVRDSAALGVELTTRLGDMVQSLMLLNPIDYPALAAEWDGASLRHEFEPDADGAHLLRTWHLLRDKQLFWPWHARDARHALPGRAELGADYLTGRCLEFWQAQPCGNALRRELLDYPLGARLDALERPAQLSMTADDPLTEVSRRSLAGISHRIA